MSLTKCLFSRKLAGKINTGELKEAAAEYESRGMSTNDAMIRAVQEKVDALQLEEKKIISTVRQAYEADTGKKRQVERDSFTIERGDGSGKGNLETVTFKRGEYVSAHSISAGANGQVSNGVIEGISHAKQEAKINGVWHPFGAIYKAEKPAEIKSETVPMSKVIDDANKKHGVGLTDEDKIMTLSEHDNAMESARTGAVSLDAFQQAYRRMLKSEQAVKAEMNAKTKDELLRAGGQMFAYRNRDSKKAEIVDALFNEMLTEFALGKNRGVSYVLGGGMNTYENAKRKAIDDAVKALTDADLKAFADEVTKARAEIQQAREQRAAAVADPKTLEDFTTYINTKMREGDLTFKEARLTLSLEQRAKMDELTAEKTRGERLAKKQEHKTEVRTAGQVVDGNIIETKHTQKGHDLFVVQLAERVSREDYDTLNADAKKMGGYYSSFRGRGAVPGFQFKDRAAAEAFVKLAKGDKSEAQEVAKARRDAFEDDKSQSAVERLNEMSDALEERADEVLSRDRKVNTSRRARMAASVEAAANNDKALAQTMRNIAKAIENGTTKFLDRVRQKVQVQMLGTLARAARDAAADYEFPLTKGDRHWARPNGYEDRVQKAPTVADADHAEWPQYTLFRSDLASLGRRLSEIDGTKKLGQRLLKVADDVTDAYLKFAKENLLKVSAFSTRDGGRAVFPNKDAAELSIARSGYRGTAIVLPIKRGENLIVLSPAEAQKRGIWQGDDDKKITLSPEFASELVEAIGRLNRRTNKVDLPWQLETTHYRREVLSRMGIETPAELRAALREFIGLQEAPKEADKIKQMEREMIGRRKDGLDFFPTPAAVAQEMVDTAGVQAGMRVLEPSAGMGHIADMIREAGAEPDVVEMSGDRRALLEAKGYNLVGHDFMEVKEAPRGFTYGDLMEAPDGQRGILRGLGGMGSDRVQLVDQNNPGKVLGYYSFGELEGVELRGPGSGYDRIIMNPPFSDRRDAQHVMHAYDLLKPGGRLVAIMGEGTFFGQDKKAQEFRAWLDKVGGTDEKLAEGTFMDPSLPVNTGVNARMVVVDKPETTSESETPPAFDRAGFMLPVGMDKADVQAEVNKLSAGWKNAPNIHVVQSVSELPVATPSDVRGMIYRGEIWVVGDNNHSVGDVKEALFHEVLGHAGIRGMLADTLNKELRAIAMKNDGLRAAAAKWRRDNAALREMYSAERWHTIGIEEALSDMAAKDIPVKGIDKLLAAVQKALRSIGMGWVADMMESKTNAEVLQFLADARRHIETPETPHVYTGKESPAFSKARDAARFTDQWEDDNGRPIYYGKGWSLQAENQLDTSKDLQPNGLPMGQVAEVAAGNKVFNFSIVDPSGRHLGNATLQINKRGDIVAIHDIEVKIKNQGLGTNIVRTIVASSPEPVRVIQIVPSAQKFWESVGTYGQDTYDNGTIDWNSLSQSDRGGARGVAPTSVQEQRKAAAGSEGKLAEGNETGKDAGLDKPAFSRVSDAADTFLGQLGVQQDIRNKVSDLFQSEKTFNGWWHKTVGTQYHKAQIDKDFGRVYNAVQRYLTSVSRFANDAADMAPTLLPKLDGLRDLMKKPASRVDTAAAGKAIFEGTLTDQKVYSDDELRSKFGLTDNQIQLYREFRAAADKSLDDMGKTDILRYAGKDVAHLTDQVMAAEDVTAGAELVAKQLDDIGEEGAAAEVRNKAQRIAQLKQEGYAPLMRFGEHTVYVTDKAGNQIFFGMAESGREAAALARDMQEAYPDAVVTKGMLSTEGAKLFAGISPDTIEVFAQTTGLDKNPLFQDYLKLVVNNRSALKRLIERKGVAGFSQDTTRVLASFLTSNARASSKNLHAGEMTSAANEIPKEKGDVRDEAIRLVDYIQNPVEEAAKVRGLLFTNFIGGSIASAAVNMTQPVMMTLPYLAQFGGAVKATKELAAAMKMAATHTSSETLPDADLRAAMHRAESEGIVSPQEIHNLQAEAQRSSKGFTIAGKEIVPAFAMRKMAIVWGGFFGLAEQFNRRSTFIAAYHMAKDMTPEQLSKAGAADAYEFAAKSIAETQGVYNRGNRPDWARGALGATLMTFKQYSISYLEFLKRLPPKERALALAILVVAAGANGLPFADDLDDVIDTIGQALGYNWNTKRVKDRFVTSTLGKGAADFVLHGVSGVGGMPLDVSMRMGMGNLLPGTGILKKSNKDKGNDYAEFFGAAGGYGKKVVAATEKLLDGDVPGALAAVTATATANLIKAIDMMQTNTYRDTKGRKVMDTDAMDALVKAIGFQPGSVAKEQQKLGMAKQDIDLVNAVKSEIAEKWAQGVYEKDPNAAKKARDSINAWNEKNPENRININAAQVATRVREMRMSKEERVVKHAPKAMRAGLREELAQ